MGQGACLLGWVPEVPGVAGCRQVGSVANIFVENVMIFSHPGGPGMMGGPMGMGMGHPGMGPGPMPAAPPPSKKKRKKAADGGGGGHPMYGGPRGMMAGDMYR